MATFAVIMALYNKGPYVRRAVESVVGQSWADWEMWVVDDGSTDGSAEALAGIDDPRVHLVRQENSGAAAARNRGVALSAEGGSGSPYVTFLDADDWWEPGFLEEMHGLTVRHPGAGIYGTGYYIVKNGVQRVAPVGVDEGFEEGEVNYCRVYARTMCMPLCVGSVCMPRGVFDEAGGFPVGVRLGEDFLLWIGIALQHRVVLTRCPLSNYNQDADPRYRGTRRLSVPEEDMMWNLGQYEPTERTNDDYKRLVDAMRVTGLMSHLVDRRYTEATRRELAKVDWERQPARVWRLYGMPMPLLRLRHRLMHAASMVKQGIRCILHIR